MANSAAQTHSTIFYSKRLRCGLSIKIDNAVRGLVGILLHAAWHKHFTKYFLLSSCKFYSIGLKNIYGDSNHDVNLHIFCFGFDSLQQL